MILSSLCSSEKYFWIKVPRTATMSYQGLFLKYYDGDVKCEIHDPAYGQLHTHYPYDSLCKMYNQRLPGITLVRHPLTRFISGLHQLKLLSEEHNFQVPFLEDMSSCVKFLSKNFDRNCYTSTNFEDLFLEANPRITISFFHLQIYFMYHPKVTWFKYENIEDFNNWIAVNLGYDLSLLSRINESKKESLTHLDFSEPKFIEVVENMFYDDYKILGYPFQYLT